jgi:hypothetical protein
MGRIWMNAPNDPTRQAAPAKRRRKWPWIVGALVLLIVIVSVANSGGDEQAAVAPPPGAAQPAAEPPAETSGDVITYEVTGDGVDSASITYVKDENLGQQQENGASLPWSTEVEFPSGFLAMQPLSLVAQSMSQDGGSITCRILRNAEELTSSTSSGPFAVVTCASS